MEREGIKKSIMIRILVDAHCFDGNGQGIVSYLQGLYTELLKKTELSITFACCNVEKLKGYFGEGVDVVKIPYSNFFYRLFIFFPSLLKERHFDYAHFQYIIPFFLNKKVKYLTTIHDIIPIDFPEFYSVFYRLKVRFLFKRAAIKSDKVYTVSNYSRDRIHLRFKIPNKNILLTPNAVKSGYVFGDIPKTDTINFKYFLYVSRIEERKNHLILLKTFIEQEWYKQFKLVFIGSNASSNSNLYGYYNSLDEEKKSQIVFLEGVSDNELANWYANATLFIYPSIAEGFGIPPLEAAMHNVKVVCSNSTSMADFDFFKDYAFDPNNINELNDKISKILNDDNYNYDKIKNEIIKRYSWKKSAAEFFMSL